MSRILLLDASPLIYAVYDAQGHLATSKGVSTGLRYGFLRSLRSYEKKLKVDTVAICYDLPGGSKKAEGIEEYKANRVMTEAKKTMYSQIPDLKEMLKHTRYSQIEAPGWEADDLIATLARVKAARGDEVFVISPDNDLAQLIGPRISIFMPGKKGAKDSFKTAAQVYEYYGVWPEHLLILRAFCGDKSDNLDAALEHPGAVSELKSVLNGLPRQTISLQQFYDDVVANYNDQIFVTELNAAREKAERLYKVMSLPDVPTSELRIQKGGKDAKALLDLFVELEFKSQVDKIEEYV